MPQIEPIGRLPTFSNVSAYIDSVDIYGLMEIKFNATMFTNFNFSMMTPELVDIYLDPSYGLPDGFNLTSLNFTWNLTYYKDDVMRI